jgi:hypothetical protein
MRAILRSTNPVLINYAANLLSQEGIEAVVFDENASVMDGSMGFLPRRLMVLDEDFSRADSLLRAAVPNEMPLKP